MRPLLTSLIALTLIGCSSTQPVIKTETIPAETMKDIRWARRFSREEKIQLLRERALRFFQEAKELTSREHLEKSREDFLFLQKEFDDTLATQLLKEQEQYEQNVISYYVSAAQEAFSKKQIADAAGYYKLLLRFDSSQTAATEFLKQYQAEIEKQIQEIRLTGETYLKKKQYLKAKKVFERLRLIAYSPDIDSVLSLINTLKPQQDKRRQQQEINMQKDGTGARDELDREKIYAAAKQAFEKKDYLKAYSLFSILEPSYKDTALYLERASDKIEALKLNEELN